MQSFLRGGILSRWGRSRGANPVIRPTWLGNIFRCPRSQGAACRLLVYDLQLQRLVTDELLQPGDLRLLRAALLLPLEEEGRRLRAVSFQVGRKED